MDDYHNNLNYNQINFILQDARVRCESFQSLLTLHERGHMLSADLYEPACAALADDYEIVREVALKLVWLLGNKYPEK